MLTLAQMLKDVGYRTAHFGKWHVGTHKAEFLPLNRGFDEVARLKTLNRYTNFTLVVNGIEVPFNDPNDYLTTEITERAIGFLDSAPRISPSFSTCGTSRRMLRCTCRRA